MGVPYSKQIDVAFDQVGPFLQTAKYISFLLAAFHVFTTLVLCLTLSLILLALLALLITVNPDLEAKRRAIVTPALRRLTRWMVRTPNPRARVDTASHRRSERSEKSEKSK
jgi:hypothetical protein